MTRPERLADSPRFKALMLFYEAEARYSETGSETDRARLLDNLHPNIVLHQPASLPYGGTWRGREGFGQWLDLFVETWRDVEPVDATFHDCGETTLISTVTLKATARGTRTPVSMPICQIIMFDGNRPIDWRNFAWDTAALLAALDPSRPLPNAAQRT